MTGFVTVGLGVLAFGAVLSPTVPVVVGIVAWAVAGLGMGLSYSPLSLIMLSEAEPAEQGAASAALQLSDVLGTAFGAGIGGAIIAAGHRLGLEGWVGLAGTFGLAAVAAVSGALLSTRLSDGRVRAPRDRRASRETVASRETAGTLAADASGGAQASPGTTIAPRGGG
jgi:MFS family permease